MDEIDLGPAASERTGLPRSAQDHRMRYRLESTHPFGTNSVTPVPVGSIHVPDTAIYRVKIEVHSEMLEDAEVSAMEIRSGSIIVGAKAPPGPCVISPKVLLHEDDEVVLCAATCSRDFWGTERSPLIIQNWVLEIEMVASRHELALQVLKAMNEAERRRLFAEFKDLASEVRRSGA